MNLNMLNIFVVSSISFAQSLRSDDDDLQPSVMRKDAPAQELIDAFVLGVVVDAAMTTRLGAKQKLLDVLGHLGRNRMLARLRAFHWPGLTLDVCAYCDACLTLSKSLDSLHGSCGNFFVTLSSHLLVHL
eukprot:TRINITY_DN67148_c5_g3_i3.p1 TRINITY_DN67148_c5_g3~~TRINITY_DN67148_c5_g3_i3.p1  ORF type:complete len:130 (+),score=16.04 TRINITY_DN67148_c5_g3_i3:1052-1441(+)